MADCHVVVAGYGAVGSFAAEALVRSGIGHIRIIDADRYEASNINRQLCADTDTVGKIKTEIGRDHLLRINPALDIESICTFIDASNLDTAAAPFKSDGQPPCAVIDAIDTIDAKTALLIHCHTHRIEAFSSMGAARKMHPEYIRSGDISETEVCPLAREVRRRLRRAGIDSGIHCVYSLEKAADCTHLARESTSQAAVRRPSLGSIVTITGAFGLRLAADCINALLAHCEQQQTNHSQTV